LVDSTKPNDISRSRVRLFVSVSYAHASTNGDIETGQVTLLIRDCNETEVIGKDICIIGGRNGDGNFKLGDG
jgi:hypothetical protein